MCNHIRSGCERHSSCSAVASSQGPESATLRLGYQPEILEFDVGEFAPVEFAETERLVADVAQNVDVQRIAGEQPLEFQGGQRRTLVPTQGSADASIQG